MSKKESSSTTVEPPLTPPSTNDDQPSQPPTSSMEPSDPEVEQAIQEAIALLNNGEHDKALNFIKESISHLPRSGPLHYAIGRMHLTLATADDDAKAKHLEDGVRSAQLAVELLPNSAQCARLLVDLLKELRVFNKELESDRSLRIESPTDYGMKDISGEDLSKESRFEEDMKWLAEVEIPDNLQFAAKKAVGAVNAENKEKEDSEVMAINRRKKQSIAVMKKLKDNDEHISIYKQFWSFTLSDEKKRSFRKVNVEELENHFKSLEHQTAVDVLLQAIDFAKQHKTWTFWECYDCVMKFSDHKSYSKHFWLVHWMGSRSIRKLDEELWKESIDQVVNGVWKPMDANEAMKLTVNPMKSEKGFDECKSSSVEEVTRKISITDDKESLKTSMHGPIWAFSDDTERSEILGRIHSLFLLFRKNKCLPPILVRWAIDYAKDQFETKIPMSQFRNLGLKALQIVCFLGVSQLTEILTFLEDVAHTCGLSENVKIDNSMDDKLSNHHVYDIKERVLFSRDFACLLLDERVLRGELNATNYFYAVAGDGSAVSFSAEECEADVLPDSDNILSWLYMGSNCAEGLELWTSLKESRRSQAVKSHMVFLEKLSVLPKNSAKNDDIPSKLRAILTLENLFVKEIGKKERSPEHESQLYMDLLKKRQKELQEIEDISRRNELDVIYEILEKAQEVQSRDQSGFEGCSAEDELRKQKCMKQRENHIKIALKGLTMQLVKDLSCHDAINMRRAKALQQYVQEITNKTVCDYRLIIVPMLKSFLQSHLKALYEDAKEKSKAAEEALLAEVALEGEKKINKDSDDGKQNQDKKKKRKNKKKKKNKNPEKSKESEAIDDSKHFDLHQNDVEENDNPNSKNDDSLDDPKQLTPADAGQMLREYLENQRRFEHEASLKASASRSENEAADNRE